MPVPVPTPVIPVFPPITPETPPMLRGMQLALKGSSAGAVQDGAAVAFDTVESNDLLGVSCAAGSGNVILNHTGTYLVNWWVAVENAQTAETLSFALELNGAPVQTTYSDIGGGQIFGTAVVQVSAIGSTLTLVNTSGSAVTYVTAAGQAGMTLATVA